jgi:hypothetical protein
MASKSNTHQIKADLNPKPHVTRSGLNMSNKVAEAIKASQHAHPSRFFSMGVTAPRANISTKALAKWFKASTTPPREKLLLSRRK